MRFLKNIWRHREYRIDSWRKRCFFKQNGWRNRKDHWTIFATTKILWKNLKKNVGGTIAIVVFVGAAIPGIKANSNDDLPQIEDGDDDAA